MTATARGRAAIAALVVALVFGAGFAVRKAAAGSSPTQPLPTPVALPATPVSTPGLALPVVALPALHRPPRPTAPAQSTPSSTPATPTQTPAAPSAPAPSTPAPSTPATPPSGGGKSGPVLVG